MNTLVMVGVTLGAWLLVGIIGARMFGEKRVSEWTTMSDGIGTAYGSAVQFVFFWPMLLFMALVRLALNCVSFAATGKWKGRA